MKEYDKKTDISYGQIVAGALLRFESIDSIDTHLLIQDFEEKNNVTVKRSVTDKDNIGKYIKTAKNGVISLRDGISLEYFIEQENCTLSERLLEISGNIVNDYFDNLDIEKYRQKKEEVLIENKKNVLATANILLISDIEEDYDELVKYGFKNIDYFKSIIRANKYFANNKEKLEKYNIILKGNQITERCSSLEKGAELKRIIEELNNNEHILVISLDRYDYSDHKEFITYLTDRKNCKSWEVKELTYSELFDRVVENTLINHTLDNTNVKSNNTLEYVDYVNHDKLLLPSKKRDLKILYLDSIKISKFAQRVSQELGLDITFKEDNNFSLGRYTKNHLGDYDIIIASYMYSSNILRMNIESTEQCKDTGRQLTLLATYDDVYWGVDDALGNAVDLKYVFGGNIAPDKEQHDKEFKILRQPIEVEARDEYWEKQRQSEYSLMKGIIESIVNFYNEALIKVNKMPLNDLDLKTWDELDNEYMMFVEAERKKEESELAPIRSFDNIRHEVLNYLYYRENGLINEFPAGLRIIEGKDGITVQNIYQEKPICAITFSKSYSQEDLRVFEIQTMSNKEILSNPKTIGLYTNKYERLKGIPNKPDEKQSTALASIQRKIENTLKPLNEKAKEEENQKSLNLIKKNNK